MKSLDQNTDHPKPPDQPRPPHWVERLLSWLHPADTLEEVEGDLAELYADWYVRLGKLPADLHYVISVLSVLPPFVRRRQRKQDFPQPSLIRLDMIANYLKIGLRNLLRNRVPTVINLAGLSTGLAACLLILLYTKDEISFDRFHQNAEQIYQLTCDRLGAQGEDKHFAIAAMIQGPTFKREIPEIQAFVRVNKRDFIVRKADQIVNEQGTWVDANFFTVFSFPLLSGNPNQVLTDPHSVVLSDEMAFTYFGTTDVVGKTLDVEIDGQFEPFTITGVAKKAPQNSSIKFKMLLPFRYLEATHPDNGWMWVSYPTYLVVQPNASVASVVAKMNQVFTRTASDELTQNKLMGYTDRFIWGMQPFASMHLNEDFEGAPEASNPLYTYILSGVAFFILLIACINFINLTVAQSLKRSKEIGVRKVMGGQRSQLIRQFFGESLVVCSIAFGLAMLIAQLVLPSFNELANKRLQLDYLLDTNLLTGVVGLFLGTGLLAGIYPAVIVSKANPVQALSGRYSWNRNDRLAKGLIVAQFAIATFLLSSTGIMYQQVAYLTKADLGYNDQNLLELTVNQAVMNKPLMARLQARFATTSGIERVATRNIGQFGGPTQADGREFRATYEHVDEAYLPALKVPILAGRDFSIEFPADSVQSVLVNETFAREAGWGHPVGKTIDFMNIPNWGSRKVTVVGLVKDYHATSLREKIQPQVFTMEASLPLGRFLIRLRPEHIPQTIQALEAVYHQEIPNHPFDYRFKDELNKRSYEAESNWKHILTLAAILTIFIACIGLFGITMLSIQQRTKEIAVRKVLGASMLNLSGGLTYQFLRLVVIAFVLSTPVVWFAMHRWLENYAYKITLSWPIFALAAFLTIFLTVGTIGYHVLKAILSNPIHALRRD